MARDFAVSFYHSPAWVHNRRAYMNRLVDTEGHLVSQREVGGETVYVSVNEYGQEEVLPYSRIVPPGMCERCFGRGELTPAKVVHHITHLSEENIDDPHVTLSFSNFQRLCQDCHAAVHSNASSSRYTFDAQGNVVWSQQ